ncbi:CRISPR-associated helicase Cas3' [Methanococcoides sp.]|uniref:CRISPR-associated helicase Cas3' n=1 Tax=Methanococcoides sp. TaxID=1966350 RepID=UPI00272E1C84|nr:CRISPR-associated helicase Cas3' [Methanococcoides sp.]
MYRNWGKSKSATEYDNSDYHLLVYHGLDVAATGINILQKDKLLLQKFTDIIPLDEGKIISLISFCLAVHDIGKFSERFQNLQPELLNNLRDHDSDKSYTVRHDSMGLHLWKEIWSTAFDENWLGLDKEIYDKLDWNDLISPWINSVTGHHGKPPEYVHNGIPISSNDLFTDEDIGMASSFVKEAASLLLSDAFDFTSCSEVQAYDIDDMILAFKRTSWLIAGLAIISDWIGSSEDYFEYLPSEISLEEYWEDHALPNAEKALEDAGIYPSAPSMITGMDELFPDIVVPSPMQEHVSNCEIADGPQLFILEDATGSGKTEAALCLAHRLMSKGLAQGAFVGLPTMATSNAMYDRLGNSYQRMYAKGERPSLVLAHGQNYLSDAFRRSIGFQSSKNRYYGNGSSGDETIQAQCSAWIADNRKKALLADVGVGTIDQALMAILQSNHQSLRLLGLSRNVLIVDEVHAYDPYMHTLLCSLLEFQASLGGSVILLSATLPQKHRQGLISHFCKGLDSSTTSTSNEEYALVTHVSENEISETPIGTRSGTERTVNVEFLHDELSVEDKLIKCSKEGKCCCWIRNTVDDAIEAYDKIVAELGNDDVILFHARFAMGDRLKIESNVLETFGKKSDGDCRKGKVLIATQVVEQSLDIDFDYMVSDLAPIDLLFQRAGRLQRHPRDKNGSISENDVRGIPLLGILAPELSKDVTENWYSDMFKGGAYVYPSHGKLWLTANLLFEHGRFSIPNDSRSFIEYVFGENANETVPITLRTRDEKAQGEAMADRAMANWRSLNLLQGYERSGSQWVDDTITPTRLGESVNVRLARLEGQKLVPLLGPDELSWELSQLSISGGRVKYADDHGEELTKCIEEAQVSMRDRGKWSVLIPMGSDDGINWTGTAKNKYNDRVDLAYDARIGLRMRNK